MTPRSVNTYICAAFAALFVIIGGVVIWTRTSTNPSSASTVTPTTTTAATPLPSEFDQDSFDEGGGVNPCERDLALLRTRSEQFAVSWSELQVEDTTQDRQRRLAPYVIDSFFTTNDERLEVYTDTVADQARRRDKTVQTATVSDKETDVVCVTNVPDEAATAVTVSVWNKNSAGTPLRPPTTAVISITWKLQGSAWLATSSTTT